MEARRASSVHAWCGDDVDGGCAVVCTSHRPDKGLCSGNLVVVLLAPRPQLCINPYSRNRERLCKQFINNSK